MGVKDKVVEFMKKTPDKIFKTNEIEKSCNLLGRSRGVKVLRKLEGEGRVEFKGKVSNNNSREVFLWKVI